MIFVTLGSQKFQFDRLLQKIDDLIANEIIKDEVLAQSGYSNYVPKHYKTVNFMDRDEFAECMSRADIVITHAGTGAIIGAVKKEKKVIAVPRQEKYGEHVDNHQFQIVEQFEEMQLIEPCYEVDDLEKAYENVFKKQYEKYQSNTQTILNDIINYLEMKV